MTQNKFSLEFTQNEEIQKIDISGYLDAQTAPVLENAIQEAINKGCNKILVNFKNLKYISSAGLGVFMGFIEQIRKEGGDIKLAEMPNNIFSIFDLLGFPMIFDISETEDKLIEKFNNNEIPGNDL
ncbi:MAG: STAS domain-containing protein [bacterium]